MKFILADSHFTINCNNHNILYKTLIFNQLLNHIIIQYLQPHLHLSTVRRDKVRLDDQERIISKFLSFPLMVEKLKFFYVRYN